VPSIDPTDPKSGRGQKANWAGSTDLKSAQQQNRKSETPSPVSIMKPIAPLPPANSEPNIRQKKKTEDLHLTPTIESNVSATTQFDVFR
jgi:hypothetical protein